MSGQPDPNRPRWTPDALARRTRLEARKRRIDEHEESGSWLYRFNDYRWIGRVLRLAGLYAHGWRRFIRPVVVENTVTMPSLPAAFDGLRILHLSDMHLDLEPQLADVVADVVKGLSFDVCVLTGDCRDRLTARGDVGVELSTKLVRDKGVPSFACLGNHDLAADVERLEAAGIRVLVNESAFIERGGESLYFCGVDDPGYYETDDFAAAFADVPQGACAIVLSHDPCAYDKAAEHGAALMLCGHTHGGQMCLPGGISLMSHSNCHRRMVAGAWKYESISGYTSRGVGGSRVAARYFCDGEIVIHTLRRSGA
jgi:predicted MPP superfamily phosphohydrolase